MRDSFIGDPIELHTAPIQIQLEYIDIQIQLEYIDIRVVQGLPTYAYEMYMDIRVVKAAHIGKYHHFPEYRYF